MPVNTNTANFSMTQKITVYPSNTEVVDLTAVSNTYTYVAVRMETGTVTVNLTNTAAVVTNNSLTLDGISLNSLSLANGAGGGAAVARVTLRNQVET